LLIIVLISEHVADRVPPIMASGRWGRHHPVRVNHVLIIE
jgi:hypothetical protein